MNGKLFGRLLLLMAVLGVSGSLYGFKFKVNNTLEEPINLKIDWKELINLKWVEKMKNMVLPAKSKVMVFETFFDALKIGSINPDYIFYFKQPEKINLEIRSRFRIGGGFLAWHVDGATYIENGVENKLDHFTSLSMPTLLGGTGWVTKTLYVGPWAMSVKKGYVTDDVDITIKRK